ncbi:unnamed protein product [Acanthosepion pharaonis]|uniref:Enoyl reductase (ER) domain-containing protein n=1 Tax=Acanthosepion pharaonis TaxID=158019 RepID=A0A812CAF2_ACAPH|nr:unnamed protein product [Sepia pharaonis]
MDQVSPGINQEQALKIYRSSEEIVFLLLSVHFLSIFKFLPNFVENNIPVPLPGRNEVQVKVKACGLSSINFKFLEKLFQKYPEKRQRYIVGQDVAGIVTELGESVSTFKVGDAIVVKKPEMLSFEDAACGIGDCIRAYTALHCLCRLSAGDTVLVIEGSTPFCSIVIQLALSWGAKVITTANTPEERKYITSNLPAVAPTFVDLEDKGFVESQDQPPSLKCELISCLGSFGKWVTIQSDLQTQDAKNHWN